jgi:hypothetical protein
MQAAMAPGASRELLTPFVGTWKARARFWLAPDVAPIEATGTMVNSWVLDGRFLKQEYTGEFMGMPFEGFGYWGHDASGASFQSSWMDGFSTTLYFREGSESAPQHDCDPAARRLACDERPGQLGDASMLLARRAPHARPLPTCVRPRMRGERGGAHDEGTRA